ncbi:hypothetical protein [Polyangium sorediatum]|uniref:HEAT repeat domain-containing protein n=1 Tax=Polyangium sorediatum TaxID=889274 RepID=A0ABT6PAY0_9BACT|nr:hypothetical protein [Polyangium sorediatum]MDI1437285.1 hypothetical protein [Polyangium sorediatum]
MSALPHEFPARDIAAAGRDVVDRVVSAVSGLPQRAGVTTLVAALREVGETLGRLGASRADEFDHVERFDRAIAALQGARAQLEKVATPAPETDEDAARALLERAGAKLPPRPERRSGGLSQDLARSLLGVEVALVSARSRAIDTVVKVGNRPARAASTSPATTAIPVFRASVGVPALHHVEGSVRPTVPCSADEDDDDEAPAPPAHHERAPLGAGGEAAHVARLARDCMEDIAILGHLRTVPEGMPWSRSLAGFDQRLLDNVDALLSLTRIPDGAREPASGSWVLDELQRWAADAPIPDPGRAFAQALVLGSIHGEDAARTAVVALRSAHPSTLTAQRNALSLAPSPGIGPVLRRLLRTGDVPRIVVALDTLRLRREADHPSIVMFLDHPDVLVREAAARCFAIVEPRPRAISSLLGALTREDDERVVLAIARSLTLRGERSGIDHVRGLLAAEMESPGRVPRAVRQGMMCLVGIAGTERDAEMLRRLFERSPEGAAALGWHGHPGHVEPLIAALEAEEQRGSSPLLRAALCTALQRITGGPRRNHDELEEGSSADDFYGATLLASSFREFWRQTRGDFTKVQRYRFGVPYAPRCTLDELGNDGVPIEIREELAFEFAMACGESPLFVRDWIKRQMSALATMRERIGESVPGVWPGTRLGRGRS